MTQNVDNLKKFESFIYIINRDEYLNINSDGFSTIQANWVIVRNEYWEKTNYRLNKWDIVKNHLWVTQEKKINWKIHTLQSIEYIDQKSWIIIPGFISIDYIKETNKRELIWLNWFITQYPNITTNQKDGKIKILTKKEIFTFIQSNFPGEKYNQSLKHNQAVYIYLVENKLDTSRKSEKNNEQKNTSYYQNNEKIDIKNSTEKYINSHKTQVTLSMNMPDFMNENNWINTTEAVSIIDSYKNSLEENENWLIDDLNKASIISKLQFIAWDQYNIFFQNIEEKPVDIILQEYVKYIIQNKESTFTIRFKWKNNTLMNENYDEYLSAIWLKIEWTNRSIDTKYKWYLIKNFIDDLNLYS